MKISQSGLLFLLIAILALRTGEAISTDHVTTQAVLGMSELESDLKVVQVISFIRHGAATGEWELYKGEWEDYGISELNGEGIMTSLGCAQCWSIGANLVEEYPQVFEDVLSQNSYEINIGPKSKSLECSKYLWEGIKGNVPYIGLYKNPNIQEAFLEHGNCASCSELSLFPFEESQKLTIMDSPKDKINFSLHSTNLIDYDNYCLELVMGYTSEVFTGMIKEEDITYLKSLYPDVEYDYIKYLMFSGKHFYHHLSHLDVSKELYEKSLETAVSQQKALTKFYTTPSEVNWAFPAIFARNLMKDMLLKIGNENKWTSYIMHGNNFVSLLVFLVGFNKDPETYAFSYASTINVEISEEKSTGNKFISVLKDGEALNLRSCKSTVCSFEEFVSMIEESVELGGNLDQLCDT